MGKGTAPNIVREIATLYATGSLAGLSDAELLERFLRRDGQEHEDAFAALVARHGDMVLAVCRRLLPSAHDVEDTFQATFLVLARRASSIGRRERLANWIHGVAVRTAKEARRRSARRRLAERRQGDRSRGEPGPPDDREDWRPILDEELSRLPRRYRLALVACELEGRSRREAAEHLGIPEGTLSTHLARGRKRLRERLLRRGVTLGVGPIAGLPGWRLETAASERLTAATVRAAVTHSGAGAKAAIPAGVSSLAERVLKMMFLARLTLIVAALMTIAAGAMAAVVLAMATTAAEPPKTEAGPDELVGRVVDRAGAGVADVQVWAMDGPWQTPETVAKATTDARGRFVVPWPRDRRDSPAGDNFTLFARSRDGQVGWRQPARRRRDDPSGGDIELVPVGDVRGRLTDQDGRPIAGVAVAPVFFRRSNVDGVWLSPELSALFRATSAADGSFVLAGVPQGNAILSRIAAPAFGTPTVSWDATQAVAIVLDSRLGRIKGRLRPPDGRGPSHRLPVSLAHSTSPETAAARSFSFVSNHGTSTEEDGSFEFRDLPPGRYVIQAYFQQDGIIAARPETEVDVGPGTVATVEVPLRRLPRINGRLVDARSGRGVAGAKLRALLREEGKNSNWSVGEATTDAEGRYTIPARPGKILLNVYEVPETYLIPDYAENPSKEVDTDWTAPDVKLVQAAGCDGIVLDAAGPPVPGAEVYFLTVDRPGVRWDRVPLRTGPGGTFHLDRLHPDQLLALWARTGDATTNDPVVVRPGEIKGKVTLTVDPKDAVRIRGLAVDSGGRRISGARVTLWWTRWYPVEKGKQPMSASRSVLATDTTGADGWFVFRNLWPGVSYNVVVEARGHSSADSPKLTGKAGETHDVGKVVLISTSGYLAGRVVGSDGRPIAGAAVFNRGDGPEMVATSTDAEGRFRLVGMFPGRKYAFVRGPGYRFTGVRADHDADELTIPLRRASEAPPAWQPGKSASRDQQRAFARQILIRIWEKYGADADQNGAFQCIGNMAEIDPDLARQWSAEKGHRYDEQVRQVEARRLAETDPAGALAILKQKRDARNQRVVQEIADRFAGSDPGPALPFAEEAAAQARGLNQPYRTLALAKAGAALVSLGRDDAGRKLIDEAARDAAQLPTANGPAYYRALVAGILAAFDVERAIALVEPIKPQNQEWHRNRARIAVAIAATDTKRAIALVDTVGGPAFYHEEARTAIAYRIGRDRPDEAIRIIEGIRRNRWAAEWQAGAFGWLAVALAPRDRARADALIDRALAMMIDHRDGMGPDDAMAVAARVAACARRIGYPDMGGVIVRVMATRPAESRNGSADRGRLLERILKAAVVLALIDPDAARAVLEQVEARGGFDPVTLWNTREPWLIAWSLVDPGKAEEIFEAELAILEREQKPFRLSGTGFFEMVELLIAQPDRRQQILARSSAGGYWSPEGP